MSNPSRLNRLAVITITLVLFAAAGVLVTKSVYASLMMEIARASAERIPDEGRPDHSAILRWAEILETFSILACLTVLVLGSYGLIKSAESGKVWRSFAYPVVAALCLLLFQFGVIV